MMTPNGTAQTADWESRYYHVDQILDKPGPRTDPSFSAGEDVRQTHQILRPLFTDLIVPVGAHRSKRSLGASVRSWSLALGV